MVEVLKTYTSLVRNQEGQKIKLLIKLSFFFLKFTLSADVLM